MNKAYLCAKDHLGVDEILCSGGFVDKKNLPDEGPEKKILIADDDSVTLEMLEKILLLEGYWVAKATNGKEALYIADEFQPDLIILDIVMPIMDGTETIGKLEKNPRTKNIPVLFLTSLISEKEEIKNHTGNRRFISKPIDREKLLEELEKCIGGSIRFNP
jgi:two-component system alkaline phosphatase synthesis response regulator PhoP